MIEDMRPIQIEGKGKIWRDAKKQSEFQHNNYAELYFITRV